MVIFVKYYGIVFIYQHGKFKIPHKVINPGELVTIYCDNDDRIVIERAKPMCFFCGGADPEMVYKERFVCRECVANIMNLFIEYDKIEAAIRGEYVDFLDE